MLAELDAYAAERAARYGIVGASWAVVAGGEVAGAGAYGLRESGGAASVTPDTRFMIGSVTKSMTSFMAATVIDDGLASWDTLLASLIPGFALADPALSARVTLADSFCACTGIPRDDFPLVLSPSTTPADMLGLLAAIDPVAPLGEAFNYSNQLYGAGGFAATMAAGGTLPTLARDYDLAMRDRVLGPVGMSSSSFRLEDVLASGNYASPHTADLLGQPIPVSVLAEDHFIGAIAPAGALWSTAPDMARYLATQLADGVAPGGARVVSAENLAVTHQQRIAMGPEFAAAMPPLIANAYGGYALGWGIGAWNGLPLMSHAGGTLGFTSQAAMLPDADAAIMILTNGGPNAGMFNLAVQFRFFELLYGVESSAPLFDALVGISDAGAESIAAAVAAAPSADPAAFAPFAGAWTNPETGLLRIVIEDGVPFAIAGGHRTRLLPLPAALDPAPPAATPAADASDAAAETRYLFLDAPLASPSIVLALATSQDGSSVTLNFPGDPPVTYEYTRAAE